MRRRPRHIRVRAGQFEFVKLNAKKFDLRDTYHLILTLSWPGFAGLVFGIYLLINLVFAALYMLNPHAVAEMRPGDGVPNLMIRVANLRHQAMVEPEFRMILLRNVITAEGEEVRRFRSLKLEFDRLIAFPAVLTVRHRIDEESPLFGMVQNDFQQQDIRVMASIVGIDTVIVAPVQSFADYNHDQIEWHRRFVEIYDQNKEGEWTVDYARIDETEDIPESRVLAGNNQSLTIGVSHP